MTVFTVLSILFFVAAALKKFQDRNDLDLETLSTVAADLLPDLVGRQTRYKVTDTPDLRTLRYYITEGLLDPPLAYDRGGARFGYRHLLQIVAIKKLQSEYLPIRKIREVLSGLDQPALERLIEDRPDPPKKPTGGLGTGLLRSILSRPQTHASPLSWSRHEIAPGLEVHIRNDYEVRESNGKVLAQRFEELMRQIQGGKP